MASTYLITLAIITAFLAAGIIVRKVVLSNIKKLTTMTKHHWDDILVNAINSYIVFWFFLAGIKTALPFFELQANIFDAFTKIVLVVLIMSVTMAVMRIIKEAGSYYSEIAQDRMSSSSIFINLLRIGVFIIGLLLVFQSLGIKITPLLTALGVGGLAVALALQETLSNLFAGLHIIFAGQIRVGDFVMMDNGYKGNVVDITWRNTTIRTVGNNMIVIPNSTLSQAVVINFHLDKKSLKVKIPVGVAYDSDLSKVEEVTLDVAKQVIKNNDGADKNFEPLVRFHTFNDSSIDMTVIMGAKEFTDQYYLKHEFVKMLHVRFNKEAIVIPFPIRTVELKKGD